MKPRLNITWNGISGKEWASIGRWDTIGGFSINVIGGANSESKSMKKFCEYILTISTSITSFVC